MSGPLVSARGLRRTFRVLKRRPGFRGALHDWFAPQREDVAAVDDVSFDIEPGEIVGYIGPNGAGKSTTIKMLTGILVPSSGELSAAGWVPWRDRRRYVREIGVVFGQRTGLWWDLPAGDSFRLLAAIYRVPDALVRERLAMFDDLLGIGPLMERPVRKLSLGERMRCDLAAALLHAPRLLFLDEPTIGLDVVAKSAVRSFLKESNQRFGVTIVLTTHDLDDIAELSHRVLLIDHGRLIYEGTLETLRAAIRPERTIVFDAPDAPAEAPDVAGLRPIQLAPGRWSLTFDRTRTNAAEVVRDLMAVFPVRDLEILEPSVEDVIQTIYERGMAPEPVRGRE